MRVAYQCATTLGVVPIEEIAISPKSKDDIPRILMALKALWMDPPRRDKVMSIMEEQMGAQVNQNVGRPGMDYWRILVLGVLKQGLNCDYERLCELVNYHEKVR